ncbi:major facilitator superfamily domain-containing protein [Fusarium redolens]|uniref:Major facilitator superfamily domain-containing protein n=1 Tax=Fusarium redolens TaxID=48865 RepID=A0A9P9JUD3_FUSRE|nr:major facilitator superfamily domain-containing protein [Fusarium redolens]KAH7224400.1 major facilitator superfamily domain-containing protein [Fusarium redolens]
MTLRDASETNDVKLEDKELDQTDLASVDNGAMRSHDLTPEEDRRILRKADLHLLPIMAFAYFFQFLDKTALSYTAILGLREDLHLKGEDYSWSSAIYYFGFLVATYPIAGVLLVRLPIAKVIAVTMFIWGAILMFTALCRNSKDLLATRFFLGVAETAIAPGLSMIVGMWYKRSEQPLRQGAWFLGNTSAGIFGGLVSYGFGEIKGFSPWKAIFICFGALTIAISVIVFIFLPDTPANARFLTKDERAQAVARVETNMTGIKNDKWKREQVWEALSDPNAWLLVIGYLASIIPNNGLLTFNTIVIQGLGFSVLKTLLINIIPFVFQLVFVLISVIGSTYLPNTRLLFMAFNVTTSIVGAVMVREVDPAHKWTRVMGCALGVAFTANFPMTMAMVSSNFAGFTKKTTVSAMVFIAYCAGNIVGPHLFFPSEAPGYKSGFLAVMICLAVSAVLCIVLRFYLIWENKKRDNAGEAIEGSLEGLNLSDKTDREISQFRYIY